MGARRPNATHFQSLARRRIGGKRSTLYLMQVLALQTDKSDGMEVTYAYGRKPDWESDWVNMVAGMGQTIQLPNQP